MEQERFISNKSLIEEKCSQWTKLGETDDGWVVKYLNPINKSHWVLVRLETDYHGGGYPVLIQEPEPNQSELIDIALSTTDINVVATSASLLMYNERDLKQEFREELIEKLESHDVNLNPFESERLKTIIYESGLHDSTNLRPIVGKSMEEVNNDYKYYKSIADRAKQIITTANHYLKSAEGPKYSG